jgi:hypothetical protein
MQFSLLILLLWFLVVVSDLRRRRVPIPLTLALLVLSLLGQPWPWWVLTALLLIWPKPRSTWFFWPAAMLGWLTNDPTPAIAATIGMIAWGNRWWGGADSLALLALTLQFGLTGMLLGALATCAAGVLVMLKRRRSFNALLPVFEDVTQLHAAPAEIPTDAELPAAAGLAIAGILLNLTRLFGL